MKESKRRAKITVDSLVAEIKRIEGDMAELRKNWDLDLLKHSVMIRAERDEAHLRLVAAGEAWEELSGWAQGGLHDFSMSKSDDDKFWAASSKMDAAISGDKPTEKEKT